MWDSVSKKCVNPGVIALSEIGHLVEGTIQNIPRIYLQTSVDLYCIMPDHVHLLLRFSPELDTRVTYTPSVSRIVKHLKEVVTKQMGKSIWQKSFYDHIIRDEQDYQNIYDYIERNPAKWLSNLGSGDQF